MDAYPRAVFDEKIQTALKRIRELLHDTRSPRVASDVHHVYDDKFRLAEFAGNATIAALLTALETFGLDENALAKLHGWSKSQTIYLHFVAEERCEFDRSEVEEIDTGKTRLKEITSKGVFGSSKTKVEEKVITRVKKYYWRFTARYEVIAVSVNDPANRLATFYGEGSTEIVTTSDTPPRPKVSTKPRIELALNPLLRRLSDELQCIFAIDRTADDCHTPRRNEDVDELLSFLGELRRWLEAVATYLTRELFVVQADHGLDTAMIDDSAVFVPVVPVFNDPDTVDTADGSLVLSVENVNLLLGHQKQTLHERFDLLAEAFPDDETLVTLRLARVIVAALHGQQICRHGASSIDAIEQMLRDQLVAAIGKVVTVEDFAEYMQFHHRRLFAPPFAPVPFHHAIRRPEHYPEGVLSLEQAHGSSSARPIETCLRAGPSTRTMHFLINAATKVSFNGDRYVHGWVGHQFSGQSPGALTLMARARQFSSFILMVGRIASADLFEPKHAIIIQNKDDLRIPLMLEQIPTPKEFKDAIESLSPEQQRFARAYRGMQLESTLFGVCVVQIKPLLEKLLRLPGDSLTKEIKLTQQLLELFIEYQIPSDLISYADDDAPVTEEGAEPTVPEKVGRVADYVERMYAMIGETRAAELAARQQEQAYAVAELEAEALHQPVGGPPGYGGPSMPETLSGGAPMLSRRAMAPPSPAQTMAPPPPGAAAPVPAPAASPPRPSALPAPTPKAASPEPPVAAEPAPTPIDTPQVAGDASTAPSDADADYTRLPVLLDQQFEALDEDSALRPTIIKTGPTWTRTRQKSLLAEPVSATLDKDSQREERNKAFDLLDALSRSGALTLDDVSLHVVVAATHCFDKTLTETVIQRSVNPIEKVERSSLIVASTIHQTSADELTRPAQHERLRDYSPMLFPEE